MKITARLFCVLLALVAFSGCRAGGETSDKAGANAENLTVSAAVSLKDTFNEIGALYQAKTGRTVNYNFGSSGALQKQIETGAPVDVFASAGARQMDELAAKNLIETETRRDFARNTLVLIVPQDSKTNIQSFADLGKPEVRRVAIGNPKTVPAGQYAEESLKKTYLFSRVESKLILAEDVRQVLDYVMRGEVDAGIVYRSDALAAQDKARVVAAADETTHQAILYPAAIVKDNGRKQAAQDFINFVTSAEGQAILRKYGFAGASEK